MKNIIYRAATKEDISFLSQIVVNAANASGEAIDVADLPSLPNTYQYVEGFPKNSDVGVVAETNEGGQIGAAWIRLLPTNEHAINEPLPELTMGVIKQYQRKGVGKRLMEELYKAAVSAGIGKIALGVHKDNTAAVGLYRQQKWVEDGYFHHYIMMSKVIG